MMDSKRVHHFFVDGGEEWVLIQNERALKNAPFCPISATDSNFNPQNITYIPAVNPAGSGIVFLDLEQN
jgi:hypothetical protein